MRYSLDLTKRTWSRCKGVITAIGAWVYDTEEDRYEPCMVLVRTGEEKREGTVPCILPLSDAWYWDEFAGDEIRAGHQAGGFMRALRLDGGDPRAILKLLGVIRDNLGELISMPPFPIELGGVVAEITHRQSDGTFREVAVRDHV